MVSNHGLGSSLIHLKDQMSTSKARRLKHSNWIVPGHNRKFWNIPIHLEKENSIVAHFTNKSKENILVLDLLRAAKNSIYLECICPAY